MRGRDELIPQFELFAKDALGLAAPLAGKRIADSGAADRLSVP